jgi:hypothetical protein
MIIVEAVRQSLVNRVQTVAPDRDASHLAELQLTSIRVVLPSFLKRHRLITEVLLPPAQPRPEQPLVRPTLILVYKKYLLYKIKI